MKGERYILRPKVVEHARHHGIRAATKAFGCSRNTAVSGSVVLVPDVPDPWPGRAENLIAVLTKPPRPSKVLSPGYVINLAMTPNGFNASPPSRAASARSPGSYADTTGCVPERKTIRPRKRCAP